MFFKNGQECSRSGSHWSQNKRKYCKAGPKYTQSDTNYSLKSLRMVPKHHKVVPKWPKVVPRCCQGYQNISKTTPKRPETIFNDFGGQKAVFCTTFQHFSSKIVFSCGTSAFSSPTFCRRPTRKPYFWRKVLEGCAKNGPKSHFWSNGALK